MLKSNKEEIKKRVLYAEAVYGQEEKDAVLKSLDNQWLASGPLVKEFEEKVAHLFGKKYGIAVNSGSSANLLGISALNLPKGSKVITPALTFATTVSELIINGLIPVFIDGVIGRYTIDENQIMEAIDDKTSAILVPQLIGGICHMPMLKMISDKHGLKLIDDSCFVAGTKIITKDGEKNIEDVLVGDLVLTRNGYKKVLVSKKTGKKNVINRLGLTGTPNHPIITKNGACRLDEIKVSDIIYTWNKEKSCIEEKTIIDIQTQNSDNGEFIIGEAMDLENQESPYTEIFGQTTLVKFLKGFIFTIKMRIHLTTIFQILSALVGQLTQVFILVSQRISKKLRKTYSLLKQQLKNGTPARGEGCGIVKTEKSLGRIGKLTQSIVKNVKKSIKLFTKTNPNTVPKNVEEKRAIKENVYNLKVEGCHEYFVNGILVHNCDTFAPTFGKKTVASYADITTTSFYGSHIITACGMGGMLMTDDKEIRDRAVTLRDWGRVGNDGEDFESRFDFKIDGIPYDSKFLYSHLGYNLKMNEASAAFGLEQVKKLPKFLQTRSENFARFYKFFKKHEELFYLPTLLKEAKTNWLAFPITIKEGASFTRYELLKHLEDHGIQTRVLFSGNITRHPVYKDVEFEVSGSLKNADFIMANGFLLGAHHGLNSDDVDFVCDKIEEFIGEH